MRNPFAVVAVLVTLSGCLARTESITPMANPEPVPSSVALSLEVSPCSSGANGKHTLCLAKATLTEPTTHTDGTQIADLRGVRFSWTGDWGTNHYEGDSMLLDSPSPNGGHTHKVTFYISVPKCGTEAVQSRAHAIARSGRRSQDATFKLSVDHRGESGCPGRP